MLLYRVLAVALVIVLFSVPTAIAQTEEGAVLKRPAMAYDALTLADSVAFETLGHISTPLTLNAQPGAPRRHRSTSRAALLHLKQPTRGSIYPTRVRR